MSADARDTAEGQLGTRIRRLRRERGLSLAELGARARIATSTLSKVENGHLSLAYDRLLAIAQAFGVPISELFATTQPAPRLVVTARRSLARLGSGVVADTPRYAYRYLCPDIRRKQMVPMVAVVKARTEEEFGPLVRHDGEEFAWVVQGRVTVLTEFYAPETLEAGEGIYIDSQMGHGYLNAGEGEAVILSVNTDPIPPERLNGEAESDPTAR